MKKAQLWISAALYTALGIILIALVLSVGVPFINKIKTRNTILQTKEAMYNLDELIREVNLEGLGSRRPFYIEIGEGDFLIYSHDDPEPGNPPIPNRVKWIIFTDDKTGIESRKENEEPIIIKEGNLKIQSTQLGQGYKIELFLDYTENINIKTTEALKQLSGSYNLVVEHTQGSDCADVECVLIREA